MTTVYLIDQDGGIVEVLYGKQTDKSLCGVTRKTVVTGRSNLPNGLRLSDVRFTLNEAFHLADGRINRAITETKNSLAILEGRRAELETAKMRNQEAQS